MSWRYCDAGCVCSFTVSDSDACLCLLVMFCYSRGKVTPLSLRGMCFVGKCDGALLYQGRMSHGELNNGHVGRSWPLKGDSSLPLRVLERNDQTALWMKITAENTNRQTYFVQDSPCVYLFLTVLFFLSCYVFNVFSIHLVSA